MRTRERRCAICEKTQTQTPKLGGIAAFTLPLQWIGVLGDYAHPVCLAKARASFQKKVQK